ncbi:MAG TPA: YwhD family protein, partial [Massilibacterium sp.]|nr:YwhD family protein [Massilibacterium sp.]
EMVINHETRRGYKNLPEHVNHMDKALKGYVIVDHMDDVSKGILSEFLQTFNPELWENASEELKQALK